MSIADDVLKFNEENLEKIDGIPDLLTTMIEYQKPNGNKTWLENSFYNRQKFLGNDEDSRYVATFFRFKDYQLNKYLKQAKHKWGSRCDQENGSYRKASLDEATIEEIFVDLILKLAKGEYEFNFYQFEDHGHQLNALRNYIKVTFNSKLADKFREINKIIRYRPNKGKEDEENFYHQPLEFISLDNMIDDNDDKDNNYIHESLLKEDTYFNEDKYYRSPFWNFVKNSVEDNKGKIFTPKQFEEYTLLREQRGAIYNLWNGNLNFTKVGKVIFPGKKSKDIQTNIKKRIDSSNKRAEKQYKEYCNEKKNEEQVYIYKGKLTSKANSNEYGLYNKHKVTFDNLSKKLNSLLMEKVYIKVLKGNNIIFDRCGELWKLKKGKGVYNYSVANDDLENILMNNMGNVIKVEIRYKNVAEDIENSTSSNINQEKTELKATYQLNNLNAEDNHFYNKYLRRRTTKDEVEELRNNTISVKELANKYHIDKRISKDFHYRCEPTNVYVLACDEEYDFIFDVKEVRRDIIKNVYYGEILAPEGCIKLGSFGKMEILKEISKDQYAKLLDFQAFESVKLQIIHDHVKWELFKLESCKYKKNKTTGIKEYLGELGKSGWGEKYINAQEYKEMKERRKTMRKKT